VSCVLSVSFEETNNISTATTCANSSTVIAEGAMYYYDIHVFKFTTREQPPFTQIYFSYEMSATKYVRYERIICICTCYENMFLPFLKSSVFLIPFDNILSLILFLIPFVHNVLCVYMIVWEYFLIVHRLKG
jgi:hypothetical protein